MKQRNVSLDYVKGWAIIVVVFVHIWRGLYGARLLPSISDHLFYAVSSSSTMWCMPAFFFVSGFLYGQTLDKRHGAIELSGKFDRIFYPYLIWSVLIGLVEVLSSGYRNGSSELSSLPAILWEPRSIFWFLYSLFNSYALTELLVAALGVRRAKLSLLPIGVILLLLWSPSHQLPFSLPQFQLSFIYFAVGVLLPSAFIKRRQSLPMAIGALLATVVVLYVAHGPLGQVSLSIRSVSPNLTIEALSVVGLMTLMGVSLPERGFGWLSKLGQRSMDVYLLHLLIIAPLRIGLHRFFGVEHPAIYILVGLPLGLTLPLLLSDFLRSKGLGVLFEPPPLLSVKRWMTKWQARKLSSPAS